MSMSEKRGGHRLRDVNNITPRFALGRENSSMRGAACALRTASQRGAGDKKRENFCTIVEIVLEIISEIDNIM
jgi:hypothetical protein